VCRCVLTYTTTRSHETPVGGARYQLAARVSSGGGRGAMLAKRWTDEWRLTGFLDAQKGNGE
jgi:hypothetical protein